MILFNKYSIFLTQHFTKKKVIKQVVLIIQCHCISTKFLDLCIIYCVQATKIKERDGAYIATILYKHQIFSLHNGVLVYSGANQVKYLSLEKLFSFFSLTSTHNRITLSPQIQKKKTSTMQIQMCGGVKRFFHRFSASPAYCANLPTAAVAQWSFFRSTNVGTGC